MTALSRKSRSSVLLGLALILGTLGCATSGTTSSGSAATSAAPAIEDPPAKAGLRTLLLAMPSTADFVAVRRSLVGEVQKSFNVKTLVVTRDTKVADVAAMVDAVHPVCAVLMNNVTLTLFREYEAAHKDRPPLPAVVVMASFLDEIRGQLRQSTGISYEVPAVTAMVNLRSILGVPISNVGVVYRSMFKPFIERQRTFLSREHFTLVGKEIPAEFSADDLRRALRELVDKDKVQALWMINDNRLIRDPQFLEETWQAELRSGAVPLVVGVANLVNPASSLGTLAVVPDHEALGLQAANLIFDLADSDWQANDHSIDLPLSVKTIVDIRQARDQFKLRPDATGRIDKGLE